MKIKFKKIIINLFILIIFIVPTKIYAENSVNITIHKRLYTTDLEPNYQINDCLVTDKFDKDSYGLNDVEFTIFDASKLIKQKSKSISVEDIMIEITNSKIEDLLKNDLLVEIGAILTKTVDGEDGIGKIHINLNNFKEHNYPGIIILETRSPLISDNLKTKIAAPILVSFPVIDLSTNKELKDIHIYPKNSLVPEVSPEKPIPRPPTGIQYDITIYVLIAIISLIIILSLKKKRNK